MRKGHRTGASDPSPPVRRPAVAGTFYPSSPETLKEVIDSCFTHALGPGSRPPARPGDSKIVAVLAPHAGYEYSGPVAAHSYLHVSSLPDPDLLVVVADPMSDTQAIVEAGKLGVPVIAVCDTDNVTDDIDLVIPGNNRGRKAIAAIFWLLARATLTHGALIASDQPMKYSIEDFETKIDEEEKAEMLEERTPDRRE